MPPSERELAYLWDMLEAARQIQSFIHGITFSRYESNQLVQSAVERQLEILGEAARRISPGFQEEHPEIPWRQVIGLRNVLAHEYGEIKAERLWRIASVDVVDLIGKLEPLIPPMEH
jgi:uncharacterized protein with HEPN domain